MPRRQIKNSLAEDGVVSDFQLATIFEYKYGRLRRWLGSLGGGIVPSTGRRRRKIFDWGNIRVGARSASVENRGTPKVFVFFIFIGVLIIIILCGTCVDGVRNRVHQARREIGIVGVMMTVLTVARHIRRQENAATVGSDTAGTEGGYARGRVHRLSYRGGDDPGRRTHS